MLEAVGRIEEGFTEIRRARELDPLSPVFEEDVALASFYRREYGEVLEYARKLLQVQPNFWRVYHLLGRVYLQQGRFREAAGEFERSVALSGGYAVSSAALASAYAFDGRIADARRVLSEIEDRSTKSYVDPEPIAEVYLALGENDEALRWLDKACENRAPVFTWIAKRDPKFDRLRNDPRFQALLERMRLPP
jgi:tetratricopeptide (TPR) repeat protein